MVNVQTVDINLLHPNDWNPNEVDPEFKMPLLKESILEDEMDQPIIVVPHSKLEGQYLIVDGEHRWRAAKEVGKTDILIVVKNLTEHEQKLRTVRRNLIKGNLNRDKFTALVNDVMSKNKIDQDKLVRNIGMTALEFTKAYIKNKANKTKEAVEHTNMKKDSALMLVDNLQLALQHILENSKDTPQSFIFFFYKDAMHQVIQVKQDLMVLIDEMVKHVRENKIDINDFLAEAIGKQLYATDDTSKDIANDTPPEKPKEKPKAKKKKEEGKGPIEY